MIIISIITVYVIRDSQCFFKSPKPLTEAHTRQSEPVEDVSSPDARPAILAIGFTRRSFRVMAENFPQGVGFGACRALAWECKAEGLGSTRAEKIGHVNGALNKNPAHHGAQCPHYFLHTHTPNILPVTQTLSTLCLRWCFR